MKKLKLIVELTTILTVMGLIIGLTSCKNNDPSPEEQRLEELSFSWEVGTLGKVTMDGSDVTEYFSDFKLTLTSDYKYTTAGGGSPNPWPVSGSWAFRSSGDGFPDINTLVRNDGLEISVTSLSANALSLTFTFVGGAHQVGKTAGLDGSFVFDLVRAY